MQPERSGLTMSYLLLLAFALTVTVVDGDSDFTVRTRRFVPAKSSPERVKGSPFVTELNNSYVTENITFHSDFRTALLMIDVWDDISSPSLYENEQFRVRPLLEIARKFGWLVIHAPSENKEWPGVGDVLPGEILVTGEDGRPGSASLCYPHLLNHSVEHVVMAGFDTNYCVLDKPCGSIRTSTELARASTAQVVLVRDATLPQSNWDENDYYSHMSSVNLIESAPWLPSKYIRSTTVQNIAQGFGLSPSDPIMKNGTRPLKYPLKIPVTSDEKPFGEVPTGPIERGTAALVVVSCSDDELGIYANDGFRSRVWENRALHLEPLLQQARKKKLTIVHVPNGHALNGSKNGACQPLKGEAVMEDTESFDEYLSTKGIDTLLYVGYAANHDMLFGVGGMARYYSNQRYLKEKTPQYFWIQEATVAFETGSSLAGGEWAKKQALAYRQPLVQKDGNILSQKMVEESLMDPSTFPTSEWNALHDIYKNCGGEHWKFAQRTDAVGGGRPWDFDATNPCEAGWFGVGCSEAKDHVTKLFINTRNSGNPLLNCELPESIGNLTALEHLYTSNDKNPSSLVGGIPESIGTLKHLKCMYFSHNNLTKPFPKSLENLSNLQVFLARMNQIPGPLPNFLKMPQLLNVWFDHNRLTGTLDALGKLEHLTFLQAGHNLIKGAIPQKLCNIKCDASGDTMNFTCPLVVKGCCKYTGCGDSAGKPLSPPKVSMGECFPQ